MRAIAAVALALIFSGGQANVDMRAKIAEDHTLWLMIQNNGTETILYHHDACDLLERALGDGAGWLELFRGRMAQ